MNDLPCLAVYFETEPYQRLFGGTDQKLMDRFINFHTDNPHVWELFMKFSEQARNSGRKRFSQWAVAQRIRWYTAIETSGEDYKLSNDFIALYARMMILYFPEYGGFFAIKTMKKHRLESIQMNRFDPDGCQ